MEPPFSRYYICYRYADDIVLLASNPQGLQALINLTQSWCIRNGIKNKIMIMHIGQKDSPNHPLSFTVELLIKNIVMKTNT